MLPHGLQVVMQMIMQAISILMRISRRKIPKYQTNQFFFGNIEILGCDSIPYNN
jgi:hypothetical protein